MLLYAIIIYYILLYTIIWYYMLLLFLLLLLKPPFCYDYPTSSQSSQAGADHPALLARLRGPPLLRAGAPRRHDLPGTGEPSGFP